MLMYRAVASVHGFRAALIPRCALIRVCFSTTSKYCPHTRYGLGAAMRRTAAGRPQVKAMARVLLYRRFPIFHPEEKQEATPQCWPSSWQSCAGGALPF